MPGTLLTANADFGCFTGEQDLDLLAKSGVQYYRGSFIMFDVAGLAVPVPVNDGTDNSGFRIVGQNQTQPGAAGIATSTSRLSVRTNTVVECNQITSTTFAQADAGAIAYATSDNEITKTTTNNPKAGIFLGFSVRGLPLIALQIDIPA